MAILSDFKNEKTELEYQIAKLVNDFVENNEIDDIDINITTHRTMSGMLMNVSVKLEVKL